MVGWGLDATLLRQIRTTRAHTRVKSRSTNPPKLAHSPSAEYGMNSWTRMWKRMSYQPTMDPGPGLSEMSMSDAVIPCCRLTKINSGTLNPKLLVVVTRDFPKNAGSWRIFSIAWA